MKTGRRIAPAQFQPAGILGGDQPAFIQEEGQGNDIAGADRIHAQAVAQVAQGGDRRQVVDEQLRAKRTDGFVFGTLHRPVRGIGSFGHGHFAPAGDDAALAGGGAGQDGGGHLAPADFFSPLPAGLGPIFDGHIPHDLQVIGRAGGTGLVHDGGHVLLQQAFVGGDAQGLIAVHAGGGDAPGAAHGDRLELLAAHQGAHAGARRQAAVIGKDAGEGHAVLACRADGGHSGPGLAGLGAHGLLGLVRVGAAPQVGGGAQLDLVIIDPQVDRMRGAPGDPQGIPARQAQLGADETADVAFAPPAGLGRAPADHKAPGGRAGGAGQRAGDEEQRAGGVERAALGDEGVPQQARAQAGGADVIAQVGGRDRLSGDAAGSEINFEHTSEHKISWEIFPPQTLGCCAARYCVTIYLKIQSRST